MTITHQEKANITDIKSQELHSLLRKSSLSFENKILIYKRIILPIFTSGMEW